MTHWLEDICWLHLWLVFQATDLKQALTSLQIKLVSEYIDIYFWSIFLLSTEFDDQQPPLPRKKVFLSRK
jgi:hypothetical protein